MTKSKNGKLECRFMVSLSVAAGFFLSAIPAAAGEELKPQLRVHQTLVT